MKTVFLNKYGDEVADNSIYKSRLSITWGKAFDEIYCQHSILRIPFTSSSIFLPELAKISVELRTNIIEKGVIKRSSDKTITRYLPCKHKDGYCIIELNSIEIIDSLCENGWTKLKDGNRGAPKSYPRSISVSFEEELTTQFDFDYNSNKFPFTISEVYLSMLSNNEKVKTIILF